MLEYLTYIDEEDVYTALESQEEAFLRLELDLKSLRGSSQKKGWDYNDLDIDEYKSVVFNYIRLKEATHNTRLFRDIFLDHSEWVVFRDSVLKAEEDANIASFDTYRSEAPENEHEEQISQRRTHDFEKHAADKLTNAFRHAQAHMNDKKDAETPSHIIEQIITKLNKLQSILQVSPEYFELDDTRDGISKIAKLSGRLKQDVD